MKRSKPTLKGGEASVVLGGITLLLALITAAAVGFLIWKETKDQPQNEVVVIPMPAPTPAPAPVPAPAPPVTDETQRLPNPEPRDEQRWPRLGFRGELGSYGHDQYGAGNAEFAPGMLADRIMGSGFPAGSPEGRILRRPRYAVGPWVRVGHLLGSEATTSSQPQTVLPLFSRNVSRHTDRYDYRTLAGRDSTVPIEVATFSERLQEFATISIPPLGGGTFVVHYNQYVF